MADITGLREVQRELKRLSKGFIAEGVVVGFTQSYAIYVHEMKGLKHTTGKAGFLLDNARDLRKEMAQTVLTVTKNTGNVTKGLIAAGQRLQGAAMDDTPIDTGALRASSFVAKESDLEAASAAAKAKGDKERGDVKQKRRTKAADSRTKARRKKK
jgi:hypothetical protein